MTHFALRLLGYLVILAVFLELFFRFAVPASQLPTKRFLPDYGITVYDTSGTRTGVFTSGQFAQQRAHWTINNQGWNSAFDYLPPPHPKPLIALIGDSYLEGFYCEPNERAGFFLAQELKQQFDVYTFGFSLASLSHYLQIARYAKRMYNPDVYVFFVVEGDLEESIREIRAIPTNLQLDIHNDSVQEIPASPVQMSVAKQLMRNSAIARYLIVNLQIDPSAKIPKEVSANDTVYHNELFTTAVGYIVSEMRKEFAGKRVIFVADGDRLSLYANQTPRALRLSPLLREACRNNDCEYVNLISWYQRYWQQEHRYFNFEHNLHLNAYGNRVLATAIAESIMHQEE